MWWARNGPARIRRREKLAAAREKLAAEEVIEKVESSIAGEEATTSKKPITEEVKVKAADNVAKTVQHEDPTNAEKAEVQEEKGTAEKPTEPIEEMTAGKVDDVADEFCTDDVYNFRKKETKSTETQTLESGPLPNTPFKTTFDYYSLRYEDLSD